MKRSLLFLFALLMVSEGILAQPFLIGYTPLYNSSTFPKSINLSRPVGTISGVAGTTPGGAATYSIPIKCPPGTKGLVPELTVSYNSLGANGILGQGWNISGLSVISRVGKDIYHDDKVTPVTYTNEDAFALDGTILSAITGANGASGTTYRTEAESFATITSYDDVGGGPRYFEVTGKDGTLMQYGYTNDSRIMNNDNSRVMMWRLNRIQDINGNYILFTYDNSGYESRIEWIKYTGNVTAGTAPYNFIKFIYSTRDDQERVYDDGNIINKTSLLTDIRTGELLPGGSIGDVMMSYTFGYGKNNSRSYLKQVLEFDGDGDPVDGGPLNDTRFLYGEETADFSLNASNIDIGYLLNLDAHDQPDIVSGDFDGDGKSEILVAKYRLTDMDYYEEVFNKNYKSFTIYKQNTTGTSTDSYIPLPGGSESWSDTGKYLMSFKQTNASRNFVVSDFDGDGKDDLFFFKSTLVTSTPERLYKFDGSTVYYSRSGGSGFYFDKVNYGAATLPPLTPGGPPGYNLLAEKNNVFLGDFDGDKRTDYLYVSKSPQPIPGGTPDYNYHAFVSFPMKGEINNRLMQTGTPTEADKNMARALMENNNVYVVDFDGDKRSEIMIVTNIKTFIYRVTKAPGGYYYLESVAEQLYPTRDYDELFGIGDFNGDGKDDLLTRGKFSGTWEIGFSSGKQYVVHTLELDAANSFQDMCDAQMADRFFIGDYNGDGKSDLMHERCDCGNFFANSAFNVYYFKGIGADNKVRYDRKYYAYSGKAQRKTVVNPTPILTDVNGDGKQEISFKPQSGVYMHTLYLNKDSKAHLLEKVTDGLNLTTEFSYEPLTKGTGTGSGDFYLKGTGETYPVNNVQYPIYVTTTVKQPDGIGGTNTTYYGYENLRLHRGARGLLGFEKVKSYNVNSGIRTETITDLNRDFYVSYVKTNKTFLQSTGAQLSQINHEYTFNSIGSGYCFKQQNTKVVSDDLLKGITSKSVYTYDDFGNVINDTVTITGGGITQVSGNVTTYIPTGGTIIPNRPSEIITNSKRGSQPAAATRTTFTYYPSGQLQTVVAAPVGSSLMYTRRYYEYDNFGNVILSRKNIHSGFSPYTPTLQWKFDANGRYVISEINEHNDTSHVLNHKFWAKPLSITGYNGLTTTYSYGRWGKLASMTIPTSVSTGYTVTYSDGWDVSGNRVFYTLVQDPSAPDVKTWYDQLSRPVKKQQETFGGAWTTALMTYDSRGNTATSTNNYLPAETPITTSSFYDDLNRPSAITGPEGTTGYTYSWGGGYAATTVTLPDGKEKKTVTDATGKLVKSKNDIAGTVHYEYDSWGNEIKTGIGGEGMSVNDLVRKEYDVCGRLKKMIDQDAGTTTYNHNTFGQLTSQTDPKGKTTIYEYDAVGRITSKTLDGYTTNYTFYGADKDYKLNIATVTSAADGIIEDVYDYQTGAGVIRHAKTIRGDLFEKEFTYDSYNNLVTTNYLNSGLRTRNYFDANGLLQQVTADLGGTPKVLYQNLAKNGDGQVTQFKRADGLNATITYHNNIATHYTTPGIQELEMNYDYTNGNLNARFDHLTGTLEEFGYDAIDRLTFAQAQITPVPGGLPPAIHSPLSMSYDTAWWGSLGRMIYKSDVGNYTYAGFPRNAVKSVTDPAGLISHETQDIEYTPFHKARTIRENIGGVDYVEQFAYDASENRAYSQQQQGGVSGPIVRKRWYMDNFESMADASGNIKMIHYINSDAGLCGMVVKEGGVFKYYSTYTDHLGSIVTVTDEAGLPVAKQSFDPWGRERNPASWDYDMTGIPAKPDWLYRGYTGHEMLPEYGLINMNGRMYDPMNGRMLRPDNHVQNPLNTQSYNRFSYCWNNPLKYTDPSGDIAVWALPYIGISRHGVDIGVSFGIGAPGGLSAQSTVGVSSSNGFFASVGATFSGISGSIGWSNQAGWNAGIGAGVGLGIPGLSTNMTSAGIGWSQSGGFYASAAGITVNKSGGVSFDPGLTFTYSLSYERQTVALKSKLPSPPVADNRHNPIPLKEVIIRKQINRFNAGLWGFYLNRGYYWAKNWVRDHVEAGGGYRFSYGAQISAGIKGIADIYLNGGSMVFSDGYYSLFGRSEGPEVYSPNEKVTRGAGADAGFGAEFENTIDPNGVTNTYSVGFLGLGVELEFDSNGNLSDWFAGYSYGVSGALIFGAKADVRVGFTK